MIINRLIAELPYTIEGYKNFSKQLFLGAFEELSLNKEIEVQQALSCTLAYFLKQNGIWLGDEFIAHGTMYVLKDITHELRIPKEHLNNPNSYLLLSQIMNPTILGVCEKSNHQAKVSLDQVTWVTKLGVRQ